MSLWRIIVREILHRRLTFALGVLSVAIAVAVVVAGFSALGRHDRNTALIIARKEASTRQRVRRLREDVRRQADQLNDQMRRIMKRMGFNILILPKDLDLADFFADGYASKFMPESYAAKLAASRIVTVRHLLPILEQKVKWPEQAGRRIILVGTRGEVPVAHKTPLKAILDPVLPGRIVMGHELWKGLGLTVGSKVRLLGREFAVSKCHDERGSKDDVTVWINLAEAQELLDKRGLINAILALECRCAWADLPQVRAEIGRILPQTQVKEIRSRALARAEARGRVAEDGKAGVRRAEREAAAAIARESESRSKLRRQIETLAAVLVPLTLVGSAAWVGLLAYLNVRGRRREIAILRAIGFRSRQLAGIVLSRAVLLGLIGGALGYVAGLAAALAVAEAPAEQTAGSGVFGLSPALLAMVLPAAPVLCALASWAAAATAGRQDPAVVLQQE